jgi:hypothetical protein
MAETCQGEGRTKADLDGAEPVVQRKASEGAAHGEKTAGKPRRGLGGKLVEGARCGERVVEQSCGGLALAPGCREHRKKLRAASIDAVLGGRRHEPARVRNGCRLNAQPQQASDEVSKGARARPRLGVELHGGVLRAGAVTETAFLQQGLERRTPFAQRDFRGRAVAAFGGNGANDLQQPLAAAERELCLTALMKDPGDGFAPPASILTATCR